MSNFYTKRGELTAYALACGYVETAERELVAGGTVEGRLTFNGCTYDVHFRTVRDGTLLAQFARLSDARNALKWLHLPNVHTTGDLVARCALTMY